MSKTVMKLAIEKEMQDKLRDYAKGRKVSVPKLIRDLVDKYVLRADQEIPVILRIPKKLRGNPEALRDWLNTRVNAVVEALSSC